MAILALVLSYPGPRATGTTLIWNANKESDLAGYFIYLGTRPATYTNRTGIGRQTNYHVEGLEFEVRFFSAITAFNQARTEGDFSNEINFILPRPEPVHITASKCDAGISITWPTAPGEIYRVAISREETIPWSGTWEFITPEIMAMGLSLEWSDPMREPERYYRVARIR